LAAAAEICSSGVVFSIEEFSTTNFRILKRLAVYPLDDAFCGVVNFIESRFAARIGISGLFRLSTNFLREISELATAATHALGLAQEMPFNGAKFRSKEGQGKEGQENKEAGGGL
jgi:hypothetical protein